MTVSSEDRLPDTYDELVSVDDLARDKKYNPRKETPSAELVESIRSTGIKYALTTRRAPDDSGYLITDGFQRYQAAIELGYDEVPCNVYGTEQALIEARRASINDEWTTAEVIKHHVNTYEYLIEQGHTRREAIDRTTDKNEIDESTLWRHRRAYSLPPLARSLLEPPEDRTESEWQQLKKFDPNIRRYESRLPVRVAARLGKHYKKDEMDEDRVVQSAVAVLGVDTDIALSAVDEIASNPDRCPTDVVEELLVSDARTEGVINLPRSIMTDPETKEGLQRYCKNTRRSIGEVITDLIEDFVEEKEAAVEG